jgi:3-phosphoshikimate 1-carboxyvinyltransferase
VRRNTKIDSASHFFFYFMKIQPTKHLNGAIKLPGDKSISHRSAIISALANGTTKIENFASSADCASTLECLRKLGVEIERNGSNVIVKGVGKKGFTEPKTELDCGNSGTTVRLLSGIVAAQTFSSTLIGDESLSKRPMKRVIEPLTEMGAKFDSNENRLPMTVHGTSLNSISYKPNIASAQVKSCVLLAGLNADATTEFLEITPTRDHTERMLNWFGAAITETQTADGKLLSVSGDAELTAKDLIVPSDVSSAAFFLVAASCLKNSDVTIENVGLNPSRRGIIDVLKSLGANIEILNEREVCNEPIGDLRVRGSEKLASKDVIKGEIIANIIDEIPILAVFGTQLENGLEIREASELRVKESDRIATVVENLRRMNADVEEFPDGFRVKKSSLKGAKVHSFDDHRIAMAFAVAGLLAEGETEIIDSECAGVSFPEFFDVLKSVAK